MRIVPLGGADQIGGSCYVLETRRSRIVIDCGMDQKENFTSEKPELSYLDGKHVDAVLFTHSHLDHMGCGPNIAKQHPEAEMFCTHATWETGCLMMADSCKITNKYHPTPLYSKDEVLHFLFDRLEQGQRAFAQWFSLGGLELCFWPAGHIRGAASILVRAPEGDVMFSGDISFEDTATVEAAWELPDDFNPETVMVDSTYGDTNHSASRAELEAELVESVLEVINRGGNVIVPAFSNGRTQDVAYPLVEAGVELYTGGLSKKVFKAFIYGEGHQKVLGKALDDPDNVRFIPDGGEGWELAHRIRTSTGQTVVSSNGWIQGGWSRFFTTNWMEDEDNAVFLTGWQKPGAAGDRLLRADYGDQVRFDDERYTKRAEVKRFHLSGHADQDDLSEMVNRIDPERVILVHGEYPAPQTLKERLDQEGDREVILSEKLEPIEI